MIAPVTRSAETRPPVDAAWEDGPEFDRAPIFRSRRTGATVAPGPAEDGANGFGSWVIPVILGCALGGLIAGFGIWIGVVLS